MAGRSRRTTAAPQTGPQCMRNHKRAKTRKTNTQSEAIHHLCELQRPQPRLRGSNTNKENQRGAIPTKRKPAVLWRMRSSCCCIAYVYIQCVAMCLRDIARGCILAAVDHFECDHEQCQTASCAGQLWWLCYNSPATTQTNTLPFSRARTSPHLHSSPQPLSQHPHAIPCKQQRARKPHPQPDWLPQPQP